MTPPIHKDWWLAAALTGAALPAAVGQTPGAGTAAQTAGVVTTVNQGASAPGTSAPLYIESAKGQKLVTGPNQTLHVLFSDQSALTVGPNSEVTIAEYRYDSKTRDGNVLVDMTKGLLRVVGGFISKKNETVVRTSTATIGIRGGITVVNHEEGKTSGVFLFGQSMRTTSQDGQNTQTVTRQGFGVDMTGNSMGSPRQFPSSEISQLVSQLETQPNGQQTGSNNPGGAPPGQLLSTGQSGGGNPNSLANDRLKNVVDNNAGLDPQRTLQNILGSGNTPNPIPAS